MKQVVIKSGSAQIANTPSPLVEPKTVLVDVKHSLISAGTEMQSVNLSAMPLYKRALKQPENVKKVLTSIKNNGLKSTIERVKGQLDFGSPTGYSAAGEIIAVGDEVEHFKVGDLVACAGAGIANHAEIINVPVNLCVKLPHELDTLLGSTVTLGAIAMQGLRRFNPTLGETVLVVGAGLLGIITLQLLKANGCHVIVVDISEQRLSHAQTLGADLILNPSEGYADEVSRFTEGYGADGVIITAGSSSDDIIHQAALATRRKGRIVLVGDVGLGLKREDFYKKEIDFLISCSYGPGRYDAAYEIEGQDYPLPYVRWTENRNMASYLHLLAQDKIKLPRDHVFSVDECEKAYASLKQGPSSPIAVFLTYPRSVSEKRQTKITLLSPKTATLSVALIGASSFVQSIHVPHLKKIGKTSFSGVMSKTGSSAASLAKQISAAYATTELNEILQDKGTNIVVISSKHHLHGHQVLSALRAGKHVFAEKPLVTTQTELDEIKRFYEATPNAPLLMTGFNRRFSPIMQKLKANLRDRKTPLMINYRMNGGFIPKDHWIQTHEGAGRNIGEACHIYDLFNFLTGSTFTNVQAASIRPSGEQWLKNDNFSATISYADGSVANLIYTSLGSKSHPKETMEIFTDGVVYSMSDYKSLTKTAKSTETLYQNETIDKGHAQEMEAFIAAIESGSSWPITLHDQINATQISFDVEHGLQKE